LGENDQRTDGGHPTLQHRMGRHPGFRLKDLCSQQYCAT
jgi:hypothetical protein